MNHKITVFPKFFIQFYISIEEFYSSTVQYERPILKNTRSASPWSKDLNIAFVFMSANSMQRWSILTCVIECSKSWVQKVQRETILTLALRSPCSEEKIAAYFVQIGAELRKLERKNILRHLACKFCVRGGAHSDLYNWQRLASKGIIGGNFLVTAAIWMKHIAICSSFNGHSHGTLG